MTTAESDSALRQGDSCMNPKMLLCLAVPVLVTIPALPAGAIAPVMPCAVAGGDVLIPPGGFLAGFVAPACVVTSGSEVRWVNMDFAPHDPGSFGDHGDCFRADRDADGGANDLGGPQGPGEDYAVRFGYDGTQVTASFGGGPGRACDAAELGGAAAVLRYQCYIHPAMAGALVILAA